MYFIRPSISLAPTDWLGLRLQVEAHSGSPRPRCAPDDHGFWKVVPHNGRTLPTFLLVCNGFFPPHSSVIPSLGPDERSRPKENRSTKPAVPMRRDGQVLSRHRIAATRKSELTYGQQFSARLRVAKVSFNRRATASAKS